MQFDANLAPARANTIPGQPGAMGAEIELYEELLAFAEMSPEEQELYFAEAKSAGEALQATEPSRREHVEPKAIDSIDSKPKEGCEPVAIARIDPENVSPSAESVDYSDSTPLDEKVALNKPVVELSDGGDPLVDLNLEGDFTNVLSGKDCLACGAESDADDLFCMSCGSFLNGVASNAPSNPVCTDCSQSIAIDEIFCPWCGSVLAGR